MGGQGRLLWPVTALQDYGVAADCGQLENRGQLADPVLASAVSSYRPTNSWQFLI